MGSENGHGLRTKYRECLGTDFIVQYNKNGDEFLIHIVRVTGNEP
jgi:hypothetical protein